MNGAEEQPRDEHGRFRRPANFNDVIREKLGYSRQPASINDQLRRAAGFRIEGDLAPVSLAGALADDDPAQADPPELAPPTGEFGGGVGGIVGTVPPRSEPDMTERLRNAVRQKLYGLNDD